MACCCCLPRSDCVLAISIYGVSISVALLAVLGLHGHDFGPGFSNQTTEVLHKTSLSVYAICLSTNLLVFLGILMASSEKWFLIPWLVSHTLLVVALMAASLYYLVLYTTFVCLDDCTILLGYSISIIVAIVTLLYCIYVVQDHFDVLVHQQKLKKKAESLKKIPQVTSL